MITERNYDRRSLIKFFTHLIVIILIFFLPDMMMNITRQHRFPKMEHIMYAKAAAYVVVFYLNYYLIINRTLLAKKSNVFTFILWNLLLIIVFITFFYYLRQMIWGGPHMQNHHNQEIPRIFVLTREWSYILRDVGVLILTIALSTALRVTEKWTATEKRHEQILASKRDEELKHLKSQLNPHFLFNTLNTIYSLIDIDPKEAQNAIHQLSKLLRQVLYESPMLQPLSKEIDFAKTYISLMEMRLGQGRVKADFDHVADQDLMVPSLMFVSLIENAFKHGNTGAATPIEISISSDSDGNVVCRTFNHFVAMPSTSNAIPSTKEGGIGLANVRRRLQLTYGHDASLNTSTDGNTFTAVLTINTHNHDIE